MALPQILEGTWEEIKQHELELTGRWLRVIISEEAEAASSASHLSTSENSQPLQLSKPLTGRGMFKGKLGGTQALFEQKQEDKKREKRRNGSHS